MQDEIFIKKCLQIAKKGKNKVAPNPLVGALIVREGKIISEGYHHKCGDNHAEVEAIKNASKNDLIGSTLYCNLEPCNHQGKTPPCTKTIIESGIKKVIIGQKDPNPLVFGKGIAQLKKNGISVKCGVLEPQCNFLNRHFIESTIAKKPYIHLKLAASLDGKIALANGQSKWITNEAARRYSRKKRENFQSILVGINTILSDNPNLGISKNSKNDPIRIIFDPHFKIPINSQVFRDNKFIIVTLKKHITIIKQKQILQKKGQILKMQDFNLKKILKKIFNLGINSILVEGGARTANEFLTHNLVNEIDYYISPIFLGEKGINAFNLPQISTIKKAKSLKQVKIKHFGDNILISGLL